MPGPFPGMDPYLEAPHLWPGVHQHVIIFLSSALNASLPEGYVARVDERLYVAGPEERIAPDVSLFRSAPLAPSASTALLAPADADTPRVLRLAGAQVREPFIDIVPIAEPGRVVAAIEVLSPANKRSGAGREEYRRKQRHVLESDTHLLEIDLLRAGEPTLAPPEWALKAEFGAFDYAASLHRAGRGLEFEVWAWTVRDRLPRLRLPLGEEDPDVPVELARVWDRVYDEGAFGRSVRYEVDPLPPLAPADAAWAKARLREANRR